MSLCRMSTPDYLLVCRLCVLKNSSFANIFNTTGSLEVRIADIINELLQLNVYPGDGLPDKICCDCLNELARFKRFKNISHEAKATLIAVVKGKNTFTLQPKPSTSKENNTPKEDIELVDLAENDDDSGAETIDAPSPKTELPSIELEESEDENAMMDISRGNKENSPPIEEAVKVDEEMTIEKDPLESELTSDSDGQSIMDDDMEADIVELEEEEGRVIEDDILERNCSRTLGYDWSSRASKKKDGMVNGAAEIPSSEPMYGEMSDDESREKYVCKGCSKEFPDNLELNIHIDKGDCAEHRCLNCEKSVSSSRELRKHVTYCEKSKLYACGICDKTFENETSLKAHLRFHQSKSNPVLHECRKCNRVFTNRNKLRLHQKRCKFPKIKKEPVSHYVCGVCKDGFKDYSVFREHLDAHMNIQKHALCGVCSESFPTALELKRHVCTCHGTLECNVCSKKFMESYYLNRHLVSHSSERPFACKLCKKTYKTNHSLNLHITNSH